MTLKELLTRRKRKRQREAAEAIAYGEFYTSTYGKQRPKPQNKMVSRHSDK